MCSCDDKSVCIQNNSRITTTSKIWRLQKNVYERQVNKNSHKKLTPWDHRHVLSELLTLQNPYTDRQTRTHFDSAKEYSWILNVNLTRLLLKHLVLWCSISYISLFHECFDEIKKDQIQMCLSNIVDLFRQYLYESIQVQWNVLFQHIHCCCFNLPIWIWSAKNQKDDEDSIANENGKKNNNNVIC